MHERPFWYPHPRTVFCLFICLREREKHRWERSTDWLPSYSPRPGICARTGMCPDRKLNPQPFSYRTMLQPTSQGIIFLKDTFSPGRCGLVDWVLACKPKGRQFNSQSGHLPALQAGSLVGGAWEATTHWCFSPSLSPSLPFSLKVNK